VRSLAELRNVEDPAWPQLADAILDSPTATVVPVNQLDGEACLVALQVTARSTLGALALNAGAVLVDHGWLRILGAGAAGFPSLASANDLVPAAPRESPPVLLIGFDILGGRFAVDGGGLGGTPGDVHYWGPDTLAWTSLGLGHSDFVWWALGDRVAEFYADLRWDGWEQEVAAVALDQGLSIWPPLCSTESRPIGAASRRPVPWTELSDLLDDLAAQLPQEGTVRIHFE
jgi:hypothetical protein